MKIIFPILHNAVAKFFQTIHLSDLYSLVTLNRYKRQKGAYFPSIMFHGLHFSISANPELI
jgi:hypothetical protein